MASVRPPTPLAQVVRERLPGEVSSISVARWLRGEHRPVALAGQWAGGGIVLSSDPLLVAPADADPFALLEDQPLALDGVDAVDLIGGGWIGWLGFELANRLEQLAPAPPRSGSAPPFDLAFHDHVVRCDADGQWWFEALWTPGRDVLLRERRDRWRDRLAGPVPPAREYRSGPLRPVGAGLAGHQAAVAETVARIARGDMSQTNLCLQLHADLAGDALDLWVRAVAASHPAYAAFIGSAHQDYVVASLSPELFLRRRGDRVLTRPIKGTSPRSAPPSQLAASAKDRAENVMIVDLMRNDLGRVCRFGSVRVPELCAVRPAPGVWHLESTVSGRLRAAVGDAELLRATFPPGSVTGAPKVQALRTIHELEQTAREAYCGAIGLRSPLWGMELNVAIRTLEVEGRRLRLGVGGGIVSDSRPTEEVDEAVTKARAVADAAGLHLDVDVAGRPSSVRPAVAIAREPRPEPSRGVLETIRIERGRARWLPQHCDRLRASCRVLGWPVPDTLEQQITRRASGVAAGALRVSIDSRELVMTVRELPGAGPTILEPVVVPGGLGAHKWADRRLIDAHSSPGRAPVICDIDGTVLETGYSAILLAVDGVMVAPPLDGRQLPSISRRLAIVDARRRGWSTRCQPITLDDLRAADAVILTSSLRGPHPGAIDDAPVGPRAVEICGELAGHDLARPR